MVMLGKHLINFIQENHLENAEVVVMLDEKGHYRYADPIFDYLNDDEKNYVILEKDDYITVTFTGGVKNYHKDGYAELENKPKIIL